MNVNDFTIKLANVNGTGSASANGLLMKTIFRMGVPVMGKNYFPSNIQGLPTWFEIRVTRAGHLARSGEVHLLVAMNAETYGRDLAEVSPGGYLVYDSTWPRDRQLTREDVTVLGVPLARLMNENFEDARTRILMKNICYVGALAALLALDLEVIEQLLRETFLAKPHLVEGNMRAVRIGHAYASEHFACPLPCHVQAADATRGHIVIDGNTTAGLGCLMAGATVGAWYPITPSTSLMDAFKGFAERYRRDPETGERSFAIIQAEDELSAIGMVLGASWMGARAFTPTSGPGISLMGEFIGYGYYAEIPAVIFDVQRVGPSTGMPTRTQQSDLMACAYASHGDTRHPCLYPANPAEAFELAATSFDLAERLQTPVFVLTDLDIGMNDWMIPELNWEEGRSQDRGKVLSGEQLENLDGVFERYVDVDGDGIAARTLPGVHPRGAFFTRGSGHNAAGGYTEDADKYREVLDRLKKKFEFARTLMPKPVIQQRKGIRSAVLTIGSCDAAAREALAILKARGVELNYCRVKAFPFGREVEDFIASHDTIFVVEQNRDAQLRGMLLLETCAEKRQLCSILNYDGLPLCATTVVEGVNARIDAGAVA
jgi:2-oxoglutarate/2-oxoacid ferredoxin oxidoreductase subunit alpha